MTTQQGIYVPVVIPTLRDQTYVASTGGTKTAGATAYTMHEQVVINLLYVGAALDVPGPDALVPRLLDHLVYHHLFGPDGHPTQSGNASCSHHAHL